MPKNFVHHRKFYDIVKTHSLLSLHSILSDMNKLKFKTLVMLQSKTRIGMIWSKILKWKAHKKPECSVQSIKTWALDWRLGMTAEWPHSNLTPIKDIPGIVILLSILKQEISFHQFIWFFILLKKVVFKLCFLCNV